MPKNFDETYEVDRQFIIAGETFQWRPVHWRKYGEWFDAAAKRQEEREKEDAEDAPIAKNYEELVDGILLYLDADESERFSAVVNDTERPVTASQLNEIFVWLTGVQSGRPTDTPDLSETGLGNGAATLQAV